MRCSGYCQNTDTDFGGELIYVVTQIHIQILIQWEVIQFLFLMPW